ncbi:MAG TPA: histidine phosphatase family protein [Vicinamibacterales bacterium]|nr:histidine phosphatase family protein [Vicinamibacterales bacterium]
MDRVRNVGRREFIVVAGSVLTRAAALAAGTGASGPSVIMLMRHAEDVGENDFNLSPRGYERAKALPKLFASRLPKPDVIIATRASKSSNRPMETVEPLARELGMSIDNRFRDDDFEILAHDLLTDQRYAGKVVLVCWHHGKMRKLAKALGVGGAPDWPVTQFDHVWVIETKGGRAELKDVHEKLLDGDR